MNQEQESYLLHLIAMALAGHSHDVIEKTREVEELKLLQSVGVI